MRKFLQLLSILILCSSAIFSQTALTIEDITESPIIVGDAITIPVNSTSVSNLKNFTLSISYDPNHLEFISADASTLPNYDKYFSINPQSGIIYISYFDTTAFSLNGKIFDINFEYISAYSEVRFESAKMKDWNGASLNLILDHGSFAPDTTPQIDVISPNGGENLQFVGPSHEIKWTSVYVSNFNLEFTSNNGGLWEDISLNVDAEQNSFLWTVPDVTSSNCKIKISDISFSPMDESDATFSIFSTKSITVLTPNGAEEMLPSGTKQIKWSQENIVNVQIEYTTDFSAGVPTWHTIIASTPAVNGLFEWAIPSSITVSTDCRIKISDDSDGAVYDESNGDFSVLAGPIAAEIEDKFDATLRLIGIDLGANYEWWEYVSPASWQFGPQNGDFHRNDTLIVVGTVPVNVGWLTSAKYMNIQISYDDNVLVFDSVKSTVPELGIFSASAKDGIINVIWSSVSPIDIHGKLFDLQFKYKDYVNPDQWLYTEYYNLGLIPSLFYLRPNPDVHNPLLLNGGNALFVPLDARNYSKLDIVKFDVEDSRNLLIDASNWTHGSLSIINEQFVKLLNPSAGKVIEAIDSPLSINWESRLEVAPDDEVTIEYSTDGGASWLPIVASIDAFLGTYDWVLPAINSSTCRIKIFNSNNAAIADTSVYDFSIVTDVTLNLLSPDGGELLQNSEKATINWGSTNVTSIKLEYSIDDGVIWTDIIASTNSQVHSYEWTVPDEISDSCRIRISDASNAALFDVSSNIFSIVNSGVPITIPVQTPVAGPVSLPINVEWLYSAKSISFTITYDPVALTFSDVEVLSPLNSGGFSANSGGSGTINITWIALAPIDINGSIISLNFTGYDGSSATDVIFTSAEVLNSDGLPINLQVIGGGFNTTPTNVKSDEPLIYQLNQNYPNPFNPTTRIKYSIAKNSFVRLNVYNIVGEKVTTLVEQQQYAGRYEVDWNASNLANGIYIYRVQAGNFVETKKMILLK